MVRMTENRWLILLTAAAVTVSVVAGVAARDDKARASGQRPVQEPGLTLRATDASSSAESTRGTTLPTGESTSTAAASTAATTAVEPVAAPSKVVTITKTITQVRPTTGPQDETPGQRAAVPVPAHTGDIVEFGSLNGATLRWRILSIDRTRAVLLSEEALTAGPYQGDEDAPKPGDYASSSVRRWLNDTFVPEAFGASAYESALLGRSSASDAVAGDIAYLLTARQLDRYLPEAEDRVANSSAWAQANPGYGDVPLAAGPVYWWLATQPGDEATNVASVVQTNGAVNEHRYAAIASDGVRPALKLNASAAKLTAIPGSDGVYRVSAR